MRLFNHHFLQVFVVLLITVFISNTVYAGGMMVSASFDNNAMHTSMPPQAVSEHADEQHHQHTHDSFDQNHTHQHHDAGDSLISHQAQHQSPSHGGCSHCNHCMACYSMILYDQLNMVTISSQPVLAIATLVLYLAPTNSQPSRPPIS